MKFLIITLVILLSSCESKTSRVQNVPSAIPNAVHPKDSLLAKYSTTTPLLMLFDSTNKRVNLGSMCFADFPNPVTNGLKNQDGHFNYSIEVVLGEMKASPLDTITELREYRCLYSYNPSAPEHLRQTLYEHLKQSESDFYRNFPDGIFMIINTEWKESSSLSYEEVIADRVLRKKVGNYYSSLQ